MEKKKKNNPVTPTSRYHPRKKFHFCFCSLYSSKDTAIKPSCFMKSENLLPELINCRIVTNGPANTTEH